MALSSGGPRDVGVLPAGFTPIGDLTQILAVIAERGGYLGGQSEAFRDAISGAKLFTGIMLYNTDVEQLELFDGSGWVPAVPFIQSGSVETTDEPTTTRQSLSFAFPEPFAAPPILMVSSYISFGGNRVVANASIGSTDATTGVIWYAADSNYSASSQATFSWLAIGAKG